MSYRISYENGTVTKKKRSHLKDRYRILLRFVVVLIVCIAGVCVLRGHANKFMDYMLPGDPETTQSALTAMSEEIKDGRPLKDVITTFCREIIDNASTQK